MKLKFVKCFIFLLMVVLHAGAQKENKNNKKRYSSIYNAGVVVGESVQQLSLQTVQGVRWGSWFAGVGAGLDYYYMRTLPLFVDVRKNIVGKRNALFAYADVGYNLPLPEKDSEEVWYKIKYNKGLYYDAGIGYQIKVHKRAVLLSAGLSTKALQEVRTYPYIWGPPGMPDSRDQLDYRLSRLLIKVGFQF